MSVRYLAGTGLTAPCSGGGGGGSGPTFYEGEGLPSNGLGVNDDFYVDTLNLLAYTKVGGAWQYSYTLTIDIFGLIEVSPLSGGTYLGTADGTYIQYA